MSESYLVKVESARVDRLPDDVPRERSFPKIGRWTIVSYTPEVGGRRADLELRGGVVAGSPAAAVALAVLEVEGLGLVGVGVFGAFVEERSVR